MLNERNTCHYRVAFPKLWEMDRLAVDDFLDSTSGYKILSSFDELVLLANFSKIRWMRWTGHSLKTFRRNRWTCHSPLQKRESTGASFLYWLDWKSNWFQLKCSWMKGYPTKFKSFSEKLSKWGPGKSCEIPYRPLKFIGLSTQSIQTLYFGWHLKSYHFAIFLLQILLFVVKTLKFSWSFIWTS